MRRPDRSFFRALHSEFRPELFSTAAEDLRVYGRDESVIEEHEPSAVLFPTSTAEVLRLLRLCQEAEVAVVPSGGRTGLAGGAVAQHGEVVLSLERMGRIDPVDTLSQTVRVQAGVPSRAVHRQCDAVGLRWPVDLPLDCPCQVGGNLATNAVGARALRYGPARSWVAGLQVVTMQGAVLELRGELTAHAGGPDLSGLFVGSGGIFGVITEATLRLTCRTGEPDVVLVMVGELRSALELLKLARRNTLFTLNAFEYLSGSCLELLAGQQRLPLPLHGRGAASVLLEVENRCNPDALLSWLERMQAAALIRANLVAQSSLQAAELWALRDQVRAAVRRNRLVHAHDVVIPVQAVAAFADELRGLLRESYPRAEIFLYGHLGSGLLHLDIAQGEAGDPARFRAQCHKADELLFSLAARLQGSVSAEYGVGLLGKRALAFSRSAGELAIMRTLKQSLDPAGLLNPGKLLEP